MSMRKSFGLLVGVAALSLTSTSALADGFRFGFNLGLGSDYWCDYGTTSTVVYDTYPTVYRDCSPRTVVYYRSSPRRYYDRERGVRVYRDCTPRYRTYTPRYYSRDNAVVYRDTSPRRYYREVAPRRSHRDLSRRAVAYRDRTPRYRTDRTHYTPRTYSRACRPVAQYRRGSSVRGSPRIHGSPRSHYRVQRSSAAPRHDYRGHRSGSRPRSHGGLRINIRR